MSKKSKSIKSANGNDIAVVGMAGMFPGAHTLETFWKNIIKRVNSIEEVDPARWSVEDMFDSTPRTKDRIYSKWGGFLKEVDFDPTQYGIPPVTLKSVDAVQLLALKVADQALEDAGIANTDALKERTAVIFGSGGLNDQSIDYVFRTMLMHYLPKIDDISDSTKARIVETCKALLPEWSEDSFPGILSNVISGRVANRLNLNGSNFTVDAACASSLAALDVGIAKLRSGQADAALVGAVDITDNVMGFMAFAQTLVLSPEGKTRPFDDAANGIVISEGVAALVLKRLPDAQKNGDQIYAVIKGVGSSSDGKNRSLTAPHPDGQVLAIERAYEDAGVSPDSVELVEAHGTGTVVGDQSEFKAMSQVFGPLGKNRSRCAVGSVKSNIGHTKVVSGLAGIIKSIMAVRHKLLPATIGIDKPNSRIDLTTSRFYLNTETRPWFKKESDQPRRCGVSAFGFGGTNFHVVLEEYGKGKNKPKYLHYRDAEIFIFTGENKAGLCKALDDVFRALKNPDQTDAGTLARALYVKSTNSEKSQNTVGLNIVAESVSILKEKIQEALALLRSDTPERLNNGIYFYEITEPVGKTCFLFPGQGSQKINMLKDLLIGFPEAQSVFEQADTILAGWYDRPLSDFVYPIPGFSKAEQNLQTEQLNDTQIAQPAIAAADMTVLFLLDQFDIRPDFAVGHSFGEFLALFAAGVIDQNDMIKLVAARGKLSAEASAKTNGKMAVLRGDLSVAAKLIEASGTQAQIANINAPQQIVIGGTEEDIDKCLEIAQKEKLKAKKIPVTAAFHSRLMVPAANKLATELEKIKFHKAKFPVYSNTTGTPYPKTAPAIRKLLARHIKEPVNFISQINNLYEAGARNFIEVGPGRILTGLVGQILHDKSHTTLAIDAAGKSGMTQMAHFLAQTHAMKLPMDLSIWFNGRVNDTIEVEDVALAAEKLKNPSKTTWRIKNGKALPWYADRDGGGSEKQKLFNLKKVDPNAKPEKITSNPRPNSGPIENKAMQNNKPKIKPAELSPNSQSLIHRIQANLDQFMEMQRSQQSLMERFLDMQQQLMDVVLSRGGDQKIEEMGANFQAVSQKQEMSIGKPVSNKPPVPVLPKLTSLYTEKSETPKPSTGKRDIQALAESKKSVISDPFPTTEQFQGDLLRTVSELTGYPEEMLALDAHLEADLGIDSIKRVEIFSLLEEHHPLLETNDAEMVLEELANLNTLQKIIDWYNTNLARKQEAENISVKKQ